MDELNKRTLNTSYTQFKGADIGNNPGVETDQTAGLKALSNYVKGQGSWGSQQDTIMDTYAKRRTLAEESAAANAERIKSEYDTALEDTQAEDAAKINTERESQRGFTVNMGALREFVKAGDKRVRDLTKAKDELLLTNDANKANQLSDLIAKENADITTARTNYLQSLLSLGSEARAVTAEGREVEAANRERTLFPLTLEKMRADIAATNASTNLTNTQASEIIRKASADGIKTEADNKIAGEALTEKAKLIDGLLTHAGLDSRVGPNSWARRTFAASDKFGAGQDFAAGVQELSSQEFVDTLINMKARGGTMGALSEREGAALRAAATKINAWEVIDPKTGLPTGEWNIDEDSFKKELKKLQELTDSALMRAGFLPSNLDNAMKELSPAQTKELQSAGLINGTTKSTL